MNSSKVKAAVTFIHGIGEHIQRYDHVFSKFASHGIQVNSFDQRGFGRTLRKGGIPGHNEGMDQVLRDVKAAVEHSKLASVPHFIMGHSMGGGIALRYASSYPKGLSGCIASGSNSNYADSHSAPLIRAGASTQIPDWQLSVLRCAASVLGNLPVPNPIGMRFKY